MTTGGNEGHSVLSPTDAFGVLGNETRMEILRTLGEANEALSFSDLRDRVGISDSGQFNYHLNQLIGHFLRQSDGGYELRRAGQRVVMSVLSGAVTDDPILDPTPIDESCPYCDGPVEVDFRNERATVYCTECDGLYGASVGPGKRPRLGYMYLPPAGIKGRTAPEIYQAAMTWGNLELLARGNNICPHCAAKLEESVRYCEDHDASDGLCEACDRRDSILFNVRCTNCIYEENAIYMIRLLANLEVRKFLIDHGFDPVSPTPEQFFAMTAGYEEDLVSTEPFEAQFTFTLGGEALTLIIDEDPSVVDSTIRESSESAT